MVPIVPLQGRTEEAAAAAVAARSIFPERGQEEEEGEGMNLSGTQGELPIPMHTASPYGGISAHGGGGGGHVLELHHDHSNNNGQSQSQALPLPPAAAEENSGKKRAAGVVAGAGIGGGGGGGPAVMYRECLKNHAAAIGGNATDGCGEFMPSGEEGSLEALKCSACGCHRNFHRKELDDFDGDNCAAHGHGHRAGRRLLGPAMTHHHKNGSGGGLLVTADPYGAYSAPRALPPPPPPLAHHQIIMPLNMIQTSESDEMDGGCAMGGGGSAARSSGGGSSSSKKRFRTKFTAEQKARMLDFAERVGWQLQKLDDAMVQHFCQEIGVKRRVLKVWMHNNKHNLAKKPLQNSLQPQQPHPIPMPMPSPPMPMPPSQPGSSCHRSPTTPPLPLKLE